MKSQIIYLLLWPLGFNEGDCIGFLSKKNTFKKKEIRDI